MFKIVAICCGMDVRFSAPKWGGSRFSYKFSEGRRPYWNIMLLRMMSGIARRNQVTQTDGEGAVVVKLRHVLDPIIARCAAVEGDTADHAVFEILIVFEVLWIFQRSLTSNRMAPAPNAVGSSFPKLRFPITTSRIPGSSSILTFTSSCANWAISPSSKRWPLFASAASALTMSRYFAMASLPEKPLVLYALTV